MKNVNGYGGIVKLGGKRRRPWAVRLTVDWFANSSGKLQQKFKYLSYHSTQREAKLALAKYNENPYDLKNDDITFDELFQLWFKDKKNDILQTNAISANRNISTYNGTYKHLQNLHQMKIKEIRLIHLQNTFDSKKHMSTSTLMKMKIIVDGVMKIAMQNDIINKNYSDYVQIKSTHEPQTGNPFSIEEIKEIWKDKNVKDVDTILILIYTGLRIMELLTIKKENIYLDKDYMIGGIKTKSGTNRVIPIHNKIKPLIVKRMKTSSDMLIDNFRYHSDYYAFFNPYMAGKKLEHTPHALDAHLHHVDV